ncbi:hypothetical protein MTO96_003561 [Rhipicephalus appendiculatus]
MPAAPKVAYVVHENGYRAIVPVKLIKDIEPITVASCHKNKDVYWKSNLEGDIEEGSFRGNVILLGGKTVAATAAIAPGFTVTIATAAHDAAIRASFAFFRAAAATAMPIDATGTTP